MAKILADGTRKRAALFSGWKKQLAVLGVRRIIQAAGAELRYLPPYSPDLNPIEMAFAKLKAHLRKANERSIPALWHRIGSILNLFPPDQCANFFDHAGYA